MLWIIQLFVPQSSTFTIDRIEPPWAIIEWENLELSHIPLDQFPNGVLAEEGASYTLTIQVSRLGLPQHQVNPLILWHDYGFVALPATFTAHQNRPSPIPISKEDHYACSLLKGTICYRIQITANPQPQSRPLWLTEIFFD